MRDYVSEIGKAVEEKDLNWFIENLNFTEVWMMTYDILDTVDLSIDDFRYIAGKAENLDDGFFTYIIAKCFIELLLDRNGENTEENKQTFIEEMKYLIGEKSFLKNELMSCAASGYGYDETMDLRSYECSRFCIAQKLRADNADITDIERFMFEEDNTVLSKYDIPDMFK